tara:strand:- start:921 stop:1259 length:339 start_codon:yes stop_codon:yes gene_type:complete
MSKKRKEIFQEIDIDELTDQELLEAVRQHMMKFNRTLAPIEDPDKLLSAFLRYAMTLSYDVMHDEGSRASSLIGTTWREVIEAAGQKDSLIDEKVKIILNDPDVKDFDEKLH